MTLSKALMPMGCPKRRCRGVRAAPFCVHAKKGHVTFNTHDKQRLHESLLTVADPIDGSKQIVRGHMRRYRRLPLACSPEAVLVQAGLEAPSVAAFLHENMPDFVDDAGMASAADVYGYLSQSGDLTCLNTFRLT